MSGFSIIISQRSYFLIRVAILISQCSYSFSQPRTIILQYIFKEQEREKDGKTNREGQGEGKRNLNPPHVLCTVLYFQRYLNQQNLLYNFQNCHYTAHGPIYRISYIFSSYYFLLFFRDVENDSGNKVAEKDDWESPVRKATETEEKLMFAEVIGIIVDMDLKRKCPYFYD